MSRNDDGRGSAGVRVAGLSADLAGTADRRPPLVLLHGLTFDRTMWNTTLAELSRLDPGRQTLTIDLPGHGRSDPAESYGVDIVVGIVHDAIGAAGLTSPVMVGHSMAAILAESYAARYTTSGVVNVDQSMRMDRSSAMLRSMAPQLRGPGFPSIWAGFRASMHIERLPMDAQAVLGSTSDPRQDLVLGYWDDPLTRDPAESNAWAQELQTGLRAANVPQMYVAGEELEAQDREWMLDRFPQTVIKVLPGSGHFPHLAHPMDFARCLLETAAWPRRG